MKIILKILLLGMIVMAVQKVIYAQGEAAVPFLEIAPDSRAGAMGESGAGLADNSSAIFWNPAGIAFLKGTQVSITHSNWLPQFHLDIFYDYLTFRRYINAINGNLTASITYMNYGQFNRTTEQGPTVVGTFNSFDAALTVGYATRLSPDWGLGFNFRLIRSQLSDQPTGQEVGTGVATSVSFDIAGMWRPGKLIIPFTDIDIGKRFSIGANLSNLGPKINYIDRQQADPIPTNLRLGFAYQIFKSQYNSLMYTLDFNKLLINKDSTHSQPFYQAIFTSWTNRPFSEELRTITTGMGLEYWYGTPGDFLFALRAGYFYEDPGFGGRKFITFGAGIRYDIYGFDFSYLTTSVFKNMADNPLNDTLRFTISIGWGGAQNAITGLPRGM